MWKAKKLELKSIIGESQLTRKIRTIIVIEHWPRSEKPSKVPNKRYWTKQCKQSKKPNELNKLVINKAKTQTNKHITKQKRKQEIKVEMSFFTRDFYVD